MMTASNASKLFRITYILDGTRRCGAFLVRGRVCIICGLFRSRGGRGFEYRRIYHLLLIILTIAFGVRPNASYHVDLMSLAHIIIIVRSSCVD